VLKETGGEDDGEERLGDQGEGDGCECIYKEGGQGVPVALWRSRHGSQIGQDQCR
jgi:hypothetical protein